MDIRAELRSAAKRANQRMVRLERSGIKSFALKIAQNDIQNVIGRKGKKRFIENTKKMSYADVEKELKYVQKFLNSASSTVTGIKKYVGKRSRTLVKKYGVNPEKLNDLYKIFNSEDYKKMIENIPSKIVLSAITEKVNSGEKVENIIQKFSGLLANENDMTNSDLLNNFLDEFEEIDENELEE